MSAIEADVVVDSRGSTCPGPLMDLIGKIKSVDSGTVIELQTSDEGSKDDVPEWLNKAGHELVETVDEGDYYSIFVKKS
ncbi:sulfurtransferase TusA family protein [Halobacteriaceae archaeon GCM10025711]